MPTKYFILIIYRGLDKRKYLMIIFLNSHLTVLSILSEFFNNFTEPGISANGEN